MTHAAYSHLTEDVRQKMRGVEASVTSMDVIDKQGGDSSGPIIEAIVSTEERDRDGDIIRQDFDLEPYRANPVIPWVHDYTQPPVAKANDVQMRPAGLWKRVEFTARDLYPFGHTVGRMYTEGFLSAFSIGFLPLEVEPLEGADGYEIRRSEILESSALLVQSNRQALVQARGAGIDLEPVADAMAKAIDELGDDDPVRRELYERVWKDAGGREVVAQAIFGAHFGERAAQKMAEMATDRGEILAKAGRVLSAANYQKLKTAHDNIGDVLDSARDPETAEGDEEKSMEQDKGAGTSDGDDSGEEVLDATPAEPAEKSIDDAALTKQLNQAAAESVHDLMWVIDERLCMIRTLFYHGSASGDVDEEIADTFLRIAAEAQQAAALVMPDEGGDEGDDEPVGPSETEQRDTEQDEQQDTKDAPSEGAQSPTGEDAGGDLKIRFSA